MRLFIFTTIVVCGLLSSPTIKAEQININEAQNNAQRFLTVSRKSLKGQSTRTSDRLTLAYTSQSNFNEDENCFYVFNRSNGGYIITAADNCAQEILGIVDNGEFNYDTMPENMKWWLSQYTEQISEAMLYNSTNGDMLVSSTNVLTSTGSNESRVSVSAMCKTKWDQGTYYNNECPEIDGKKTYVGCVATALGQVMKYHNWPETGADTYSYTDYSSGSTISVDFSQGNYDWDNMPEQLNSSSTEAEVNAVAHLLFHCGAMVNMSYSTSGSSAYMTNIVSTLRRYMNYSKSVSYRDRSYFTDKQWEEIIYNEIVNNRPVCYSGGTIVNRHAFICDGYNADDNTFHFNWGWSGNGDGYFKLNALEPFGASNTSYVFNEGQGAVVGIQPPTENDCFDAPIFSTGNLNGKVSNSTLKLQSIKADGTGGLFTCVTNYCSPDVSAVINRVGYKLVDPETLEETILEANYDFVMNTKCDASIYGTSFPKLSMSNGSQLIASPVYKDNTDGEWKPVIFMEGAITEVIVTRGEDGKYSVEQRLTPASLSIDDMKIEQAIAGKTLEADLTVSNSGQTEYNGELTISLIDSNGAEAANFSQTVEVSGNSTQSVAISGSLANIPSGSYLMLVNNDSGEQLNNSSMDVEVKAPVITGIDQVVSQSVKIVAGNNTITVVTDQDVNSIKLFNTVGVLVTSARNSNTLSIENVTTGIYVVKVECDVDTVTEQILVKEEK
ncbi:MAG: C10 family peptidase [Muribaculaceae bacterium]